MVRKPNYRFDRLERERKKAEKNAAKLKAKRDAKGGAKDFPDNSSENIREASLDGPAVDAHQDVRADD